MKLFRGALAGRGDLDWLTLAQQAGVDRDQARLLYEDALWRAEDDAALAHDLYLKTLAEVAARPKPPDPGRITRVMTLLGEVSQGRAARGESDQHRGLPGKHTRTEFLATPVRPAVDVELSAELSVAIHIAPHGGTVYLLRSAAGAAAISGGGGGVVAIGADSIAVTRVGGEMDVALEAGPAAVVTTFGGARRERSLRMSMFERDHAGGARRPRTADRHVEVGGAAPRGRAARAAIAPRDRPAAVLEDIATSPVLRAATGALTGAAAGFRDELARSKGVPLPAALAAAWSRRFAHRVEHVAIHVDPAADAAARAIGARAFAIGPRLYFAGGEWAPGTPAGDRLLAHELAHVVQFERGDLASLGAGEVSAAADPAERAADALAADALAGDRRPEPDATTAAGPASGSPDRLPILRAEGWLNGTRLTIHVEFNGHSIGHDFDLPAAHVARFAADPALVNRFAQAVEASFRPGGQPVFESSLFLSNVAITSRLEQDLGGWLDGRGLVATSGFLAERDRALRSLQFLRDVEEHLRGHGIEPGTVDWVQAAPALLALPLAQAPETLIEASLEDRYHLFLRAMQVEAATRPAVTGTVGAARLEPILRAYVDHLPTARFGNAVSVHSEAFLAKWALELRGLEYVPAGFDLEHHRPRTTAADVDAERDRVLAQFERDEMPDLVARYVMDHWSNSGATGEQYLAHLDVEAVRSAVIGHLIEDLMRRTREDERYRAVLRDAAQDQARYDALRLLVAAGRSVQIAHDGLAVEMVNTPATELGGFERDIAADPRGYFEEARALSDTMRGFLGAIQGGAEFERAWATVAVPGNTRFAQATALLTVWQRFRAIGALRDQQDTSTRQRLRERLDLGYPEIAQTIRSRWEYAETFINSRYIPTVKAVALERVRENRAELQSWLDNWGTQTPALAAQYRVGATVLRDIAGRLESGEASVVRLDDQLLTVADVRHLNAAAQTFSSMAEQLTSPEGQDRKRQELRDAVGAYDRVRERILDGTYSPREWGPSVHQEARARLGIGEFPPYTTYAQVFQGQVGTAQNPFLARAIVGWEFRERLEAEFLQIAILVGLGMLTVASLLVPGAAGAVLMFIDIAAQVGMGVAGVVSAHRTLDLALLDPHLDLHGVTVAQAREGLHHAWVSLAVSVIMAGGAVALMGLVRFLGRGGSRQFGHLPHLQGALRANALSTERLLGIVADPVKLNELIGLAGRVEHLETLFLHAADAREVERVLRYIGDGARAARWVEGAQSASRLMRVFERVGDVEGLAHLATTYGNDLVKLETHLVGLGRDATAATRLNALMTRSGGLPAMEGMLAHCDDIVQLERLIARFERGEELAALLARTRSGRHLTTLLDRTASAAELDRILTFFATAERAASAVEAAGTGSTLLRILDRVPDLAGFESLAGAYGNNLVKLEGHLSGLAADVTATARLQEILRRSGSLERMDTMLAACDDIAQLERLTQRLENGEELAALIRQVERGARAEAILAQLPDLAAAQRLLRTIGEGADAVAFWRMVDGNGAAAIGLARALESSPGLVGRLARELGAETTLRVMQPGGNGVIIAGQLDLAPIALARHTGDDLRLLVQCCEAPNEAGLAAAVARFEGNPLRYRFQARVEARNAPWIADLTRELGLAETPAVLRDLTPGDAARLWDITGPGTRGANPEIRVQAARWALDRGGTARSFVADFQFYVGEVQSFQRDMTSALDTLARDAMTAERARLPPGRDLGPRQVEAIYRRVTGAPEPGGLGREFVNLTGPAARDHIRDIAIRRMATEGTARADAAMARSVAEMTGPNAPRAVELGALPATDAELVTMVQGQSGSMSIADGADLAYHAHVHNPELPGGADVPLGTEVGNYMSNARAIIADATSTSVVRINPDGSRSVIFSRGRADVIVRVGEDGSASIATFMPAARAR